MALDSPPRSMRSSKSMFGLPKRLVFILLGCLALMGLGPLFWPKSDSHQRAQHYSARPGLLTALDYQNASVSDPPPFPFCPVFGPGDEIAERRGQVPLLRSRLHSGTGARIQRVIQKAMSGRPVTISVLGGSISACHGAGDDPMAPLCWPTRFFSWWNKQFPHPMNELTNGAERLTDSAYYAYCSSHHLPDKTDLVILEFDTSDPNDPQWMAHFELLVRSILLREEQPAVIFLGHFAPQLQGQNGYAGPELLHDIVAQFYDVPHLSTKALLYQDYITNPQGTRESYYTDMVLANSNGHSIIADVLVSYIESQVCAGWSTTLGHAFDVPYMGAGNSESGSGNGGANPLIGEFIEDDLEQAAGGMAAKQRALRVPRGRLSSLPSDLIKFREVKPQCVTANDLVNPLPPNHFYGSGWHSHHPKKGDVDDESKHYWWSDVGGSKIRVPITVSGGDVSIFYPQHPEDRKAPRGRVACWIDNDLTNRVQLSGATAVEARTTTLTTIAKDVAAGEHYVECQLVGGGGKKVPAFKMFGVFST